MDKERIVSNRIKKCQNFCYYTIGINSFGLFIKKNIFRDKGIKVLNNYK